MVENSRKQYRSRRSGICLRVMVGNFHGALKKVRLAAGFVYPELSRVTKLRGDYMQDQLTRTHTSVQIVKKVATVIGIFLLLGTVSYMSYDAIDRQAASSRLSR